MQVDAIGEPWRVEDVPAALLRRVEWLQVAPLLRGDFDADVLAWLARGRRILLDAQGLVRARATGPLVLDGDFDPAVLRHVTVLKLAEEEAEAVGDLAALGVPEIIVTAGANGSRVITRDRDAHVPARLRRGGPDRRGRRLRSRLPRLARRRPQPALRCAACDRARRGAHGGRRAVIAAVKTVDSVLLLDIEEETILGPGESVPEAEKPSVALPRVVTAAQNGATIVAIVDRRPPLAISRDGGATWNEYGGGLLPGFAVSIADDDPDRILYASRNRLYLSVNGGVFWRSLLFELPDILAVGWID